MQNTFSLFSQFVSERPESRGRIVGVVAAPRDVWMGHDHDIYRGQVCFIAESRLFEGLHAFRYQEHVTVCVMQILGSGTLRLTWESPEAGIMVRRNEIEHLGAVVGCYHNDHSPIFWMYAN